MKSIQQLTSDFQAVKGRKIPRLEKLPLVRAIRGGVSEVERAAASDFSFPLAEVQAARRFLIELDDYLRP